MCEQTGVGKPGSLVTGVSDATADGKGPLKEAIKKQSIWYSNPQTVSDQEGWAFVLDFLIGARSFQAVLLRKGS